MSSAVLKLLSTAFNLAGSQMERLTYGWTLHTTNTTKNAHTFNTQHADVLVDMQFACMSAQNV